MTSYPGHWVPISPGDGCVTFSHSLYFGTAEPGSGYGAAGSIILILLWTSYSSMIFFYGAEFTKAYAEEYYGTIKANEVAVQAPGRVQ